MEKACPRHGRFDDLVSASAGLFLRMERFAAEGAWKLADPIVPDRGQCPHGCGLCGDHLSAASLTNLDLTNRCNLRCPYCFANANAQPYIYEPDLDQIRAMMDRTLAVGQRRLQAIQFSAASPRSRPTSWMPAASRARGASR